MRTGVIIVLVLILLPQIAGSGLLCAGSSTPAGNDTAPSSSFCNDMTSPSSSGNDMTSPSSSGNDMTSPSSSGNLAPTGSPRGADSPSTTLTRKDLSVTEATAPQLDRVPVYIPGEMLRFQLYYGPINAGEAVMKINKVNFGGRELWHAIAEGYTTGLADRLFKVYDVYESYMDPLTGLPVKAIRNISEGRYRYYNEVLYNRNSHTVESQLSGIHEVPPGIMDMVSAIYKLRDTLQTITLYTGAIIEMQTYFSDEIYPLVVRFRGTETIRTRMGRFHTLKFSPVSEPGRLFKTEDDIMIWLSNDRNYVPLRVSLNMLVGAVRMDLVEHSGLRFRLVEAQ